MQEQNKNSKAYRATKGMHMDFSPHMQPEDTIRFALNAVSQTTKGNFDALSNEMSTATGFSIDYIPLGKVYIEKGKSVIFSVKKDETDSEIGLKTADNYISVVNADLGFKITKQIQGTFRVRRGCERIVYWTDGINPPRTFNFDDKNKFRIDGDKVKGWEVDRFRLFKLNSQVPEFSEITIEEAGTIPAGSYNAAIQYLDEDLNPTEWITTSEIIFIYNDNFSSNYHEIRGSTNKPTFYQDFGETNKSIRFAFSNLDSDYAYYRVAIIGANKGTGLVTEITMSSPIGINNPNFVYTGNNPYSLTEQEILTFKQVIDSAEHIAQVENRLIFAETKGKQEGYCKLQKYASKIVATGVEGSAKLNDFSDLSNPKRGTIYFDNKGVGYQAGEMYSFGIVYVFIDGTLSPVCHIPGRSSTNSFTGPGDFAMSNAVCSWNGSYRENELHNTLYANPVNCAEDFWGVDAEGNSLDGEPIRHHRFPNRSDISLELIDKTDTPVTENMNVYVITLEENAGNPATVHLRYKYTVDAQTSDWIEREESLSSNQKKVIRIPIPEGSFTDAELEDGNGIGTWQPLLSGLPDGPNPGNYEGDVSFEHESEVTIVTTASRKIDSDIMGIVFSEIEKPAEFDGTPSEVIGYYIVRNERTEENKSILDTVNIRPMANYGKYIGYGSTIPIDLKLRDDVFAFISSEHLFNGKEYKNVDEIEIMNRCTNLSITGVTDFGISGGQVVQDVMGGTSFDPVVATRRVYDNDGFDLRTVSYMSGNTQSDTATAQDITNIDNIFYLDALTSKLTTIAAAEKEVYNVSSDNKIGVFILSSGNANLLANLDNRSKIGILKKHLSDPYANFRTLPYYKESVNMETFGVGDATSEELFQGDVFVGTMNYTNTCYYNTVLALRETKGGFWNIILGALIILVAVVLTVFTEGIGVAILPGAITAGLALITSGVTQQKITDTYIKAYESGLRNTVADYRVSSYFSGYTEPGDDEIQFFMYTLKDIYFESTVNINLRQGSTKVIDFIDAYQDNPQLDAYKQYTTNKLTVLDPDYNDGRLFQGYTAGELYEYNEDYKRRNKQKVFFHLPVEYDCCSPCPECFPHRVWYSEQAFQEELTDNFGTFLANNYRDIEGETGKITNVFKIKNQLFIHTEEALWLLRQNFQEKIIGEIVAYVGTGEFFSIPPTKIIDSDGNSGGSIHKWATVKTEQGVFFVSEKQRKIFHFTGEKLTPISDHGIKSWSDKYIPFTDFQDPVILSGVDYDNANADLLNNPSNPIGKGFISVYDEILQRVLFTKVDYLYEDNNVFMPVNEKYTFYNGHVYRFNNYQKTINDRKALGWIYSGIVFYAGIIQMKFIKTVAGVLTTEYETSTYIDTVSNFITGSKAWTISYSLKKERKGWLSMHSYLPSFYLSDSEYFYSWRYVDSKFWKHYNESSFLNFYGEDKSFVLEFALPSGSFNAEVQNALQFYTEASKYDATRDSWIEERFITFNKAWFYNSRQCSGELTLSTKSSDLGTDYMVNQVKRSSLDTITIDKNEKFWSLNQIRDLVNDYTESLFTTNIEDLQDEYYTDKKINANVIDTSKSWTELENFRDKYLIIRLKFSTFEDVKLIFNYLKVDSKISYR